MDPDGKERAILDKRNSYLKKQDQKRLIIWKESLKKAMDAVIKKGPISPFSRLKNSSKSFKKKTLFYLVPHTHTDLGWLHTIQEYYDLSVKTILNNVVNYLAFNERKYVFHDVGFL